MPRRSRWQRLLHWEFLGLFLIVLTTLIFHIISIDRPPSIVWDEVWYVGDARSIFSGNGELRPEHPPLAKLFIVAGDYIFSGFKTPEKDTGATTTQYLDDGNSVTTAYVSDVSKLTAGTNIRINQERMNVTGVYAGLNDSEEPAARQSAPTCKGRRFTFSRIRLSGGGFSR
jgi:hypothetical protein